MKPKQSVVFIIIPSWNNYRDSAECICSLRKISYPNYKIILVDDNSTDGSKQALKSEFPECVYIENNDNLGYTGANNKGIRYALAQGADYILLLNNDTIVSFSFLEPMVACIEAHPKAGIAGGKIYYFSEPNRIWTIGGDVRLWTGGAIYYGLRQIDNGQFEKIRKLTHISGCMMLIKRQVFENVGLLSEQYFNRGSEWDMCYRVHKAGYEMYYVPKSIIWHKVSQSVPRLSPSDIYDAYRAKLIFTKNFMPRPLWLLWRFFFSCYALWIAPWKFQRMSRSDGYEVIQTGKYQIAIRQGIKDSMLETPITAEEIKRIKVKCL